MTVSSNVSTGSRIWVTDSETTSPVTSGGIPLLPPGGHRERILLDLKFRFKIVDLYYLGQAVVTDTPINPNSYLFDESIEVLEYDKNNTKLSLAKSGYMDNNVLTLSLLVNKDNDERVKIANVIVSMYADVDINIELELVDVDTFNKRIYSGDYELFLGGWQLSYLPDLSFMFHSSMIAKGNNFINYNNQEMDTLLQEAFMADPLLIDKSYSNLQQLLVDELPYVSLYFKNTSLITNTRVQGIISRFIFTRRMV